MIADIVERKKNNNSQQQQYQMRPIARNLKAPAPPKFSQDNEFEETYFSQDPYKNNILSYNSTHQVRISHYDKVNELTLLILK